MEFNEPNHELINVGYAGLNSMHRLDPPQPRNYIQVWSIKGTSITLFHKDEEKLLEVTITAKKPSVVTPHHVGPVKEEKERVYKETMTVVLWNQMLECEESVNKYIDLWESKVRNEQ